MNDYITTTKQSTTKPCAYFLGYTVYTITRTSQDFVKWEIATSTLCVWTEMGWNWICLMKTHFANAIQFHYDDVIMSTMASQITDLIIVYSTVYSSADQRKHQSSASLAFVRGIHQRPVNSPHKWPVTRKMFPFDDVIMSLTHMCITRQWPVAWPAPSH